MFLAYQQDGKDGVLRVLRKRRKERESALPQSKPRSTPDRQSEPIVATIARSAATSHQPALLCPARYVYSVALLMPN